MDLSAIHTQLNGIEGQIKLFHDTAAAEIKNLGKLSTDTQAALDALGDELLGAASGLHLDDRASRLLELRRRA